MPSAPGHDRKIEDIQALRGISILLVLLQHVNLTFFIFFKFHHKVEVPFYIGVEMFFLISGYVVTLALFKDEFRGFRFLVKRAFRLLPVLLLFVVFSYILVLVVRSTLPSDHRFYSSYAPSDGDFARAAASVLGGFFTLSDWKKSFHYGAMWSLSVEDQFYAAIALICVIALALKRLTRIPPQWWVGIVSAVLLVSILWMRVRYFRGRMPVSRVFPQLSYYLFALRFDFLAFGILLAMFDRSFPGKVRAYFKERGPFMTGFLLLIPLGLTAICEFPLAQERRHFLGAALPVTLLCFSMLVLLAANQCAFPAQKGPIYRFLVWTGNRSYTLYVFHMPVVLLSWLIPYKWSIVLSSPLRDAAVQLLFMIPILLIIVEPIYRWVEMPLTRFGKRLVEGRQPANVDRGTEREASSRRRGWPWLIRLAKR